jgi:hypothetical protein
MKELEHFRNILIIHGKEVKYAFILEFQFLLNFYVVFQQHVSDVFYEHFYPSVYKALQLVYYHFFVGPNSHVLAAFVLVQLRV